MSAVHMMTMIGGKSGPDLSDLDTSDVGTFVEGGYYAGKIVIGGVTYALIVAPK